MDPNACLERWRNACEASDSEEAYFAKWDLRNWIQNGGFEPDWKPGERAFIMGTA